MKINKFLISFATLTISLALNTTALAKDMGVKYENGLKFESDDGDFEFQIGGRVMVDAAFYDDDKTDLSDGTELRRARLSVSGTLYKVWSFEGNFDFAGDEISVKDAWLSYSGFAPSTIKIGNFKEPFSLEEQTSSKYITFMERALPNAFVPGRNIGIGFDIHGEKWTFATGLFGEEVGDERDDDEGNGISARVTFAPMYQKSSAVHLGLAIAYRAPDAENNRVRFRERPESHATGRRLVNTGQIDSVDNYTTYGLETAGVLGPFSLQGEYIRNNVNRKNGFSDLEFDGAYIYASWFITGESRPYSAKKGKFGRLKPKSSFGSKGGTGAWELALRYSTINLNDGAITGGEEDNITIGLNWYVNPNVRFMVNYVIVDTDQNAGDDDPNIFQMRAQVDF